MSLSLNMKHEQGRRLSFYRLYNTKFYTKKMKENENQLSSNNPSAFKRTEKERNRKFKFCQFCLFVKYVVGENV